MLAPAVHVDLLSVPSAAATTERLRLVIEENWMHCWDSIRYLGLEAFLAQELSTAYLSDKEFRRLVVSAGDLSEEALSTPRSYHDQLIRTLEAASSSAAPPLKPAAGLAERS